MGMPTDIPIIDTMIGFPHGDMKSTYKFITDQTRDKQSKEEFEFPAEYMFKDVPDKKLRDVADHVERVVERGDAFRELLQNALTVNATLVAQQQNEEMRALTEASLAQNEEVKKISSWAAILFAPTLVGTIYGMNFEHMPELGWSFGYPMAVFLMLAMGFVLYLVFKRRHWL